jgi:hypothetical protein
MKREIETPEAQLGFFDGILPERIDAAAVDNLIDAIQDQLRDNPGIQDALDACNLQPTRRAAWLAASSAVLVLLAHEFGQEVARDAVRDEAAETEGGFQP